MRYKLHNKCLIDTKKHILIKAFKNFKIEPNDHIKIIAKKAFRFSKVAEIELPKSVEEINDFAFYSCTNLKHIKLPTNLKSLGKYAFSNCENLIDIQIPDSIKSLQKGLFKNCYNLKNIDFANDLVKFGEHCFDQCESLEQVNIPNTVIIIEDYAFRNCNKISKIIIPHNVKVISDTAFKGWKSCQIIIHDNNYALHTKDIISKVYESCLGDNNFIATQHNEYICHGLTSNEWFKAETIYLKKPILTLNGWLKTETIHLTIPKEINEITITQIGERAFKFSSIETLFIPNTITKISKEAFACCKHLNSIEFEENSKLETIEERAFYNCPNLKKVNIPNSVKHINKYAFASCSTMENVYIPKNVEYIDYRAFESNRYIFVEYGTNTSKWHNEWTLYTRYACVENYSRGFSISINDNQATIHHYYGTATNVIIPNELEGYPVTAIENNCFSSPTIESISIPETITRLERYAIKDCPNLKNVDLSKNLKSALFPFFKGCPKLININCDPLNLFWIGNRENYDCLLNHKKDPDKLQIPQIQDFDKVEDNYFYENTKIETLIIPDGIKKIGRYAFSKCTNLKTVIIPNSVYHIGVGAFKGCTSLESVTRGDNNHSPYHNIRAFTDAFTHCPKLRKCDLGGRSQIF